MVRHHMTPEGSVPFTQEEEVEWDIRETAARILTVDRQWFDVRTERNARIARCDWTQLIDTPLTDIQRLAWAVYRQALRDLPSNTSDPFNVIWPEEPQ